jgi:hypothetical protein
MRQACNITSFPYSQQLVEFEVEVRKMHEQLTRYSPDRGGLPTFRRRLAHLGLCWGALPPPSLQTEEGGDPGRNSASSDISSSSESTTKKKRREAFDDSTAFAALVRAYFDFYTDAMRFRTAVYFLHVSKAGGTSFCATSYENGCRDPNFGNGTSTTSWRWNCWSRTHDDGPKWTELPFKDQVTERDAHESAGMK